MKTTKRKKSEKKHEKTSSRNKWKSESSKTAHGWFVLPHLNLHFEVSSYSLCQDTVKWYFFSACAFNSFMPQFFFRALHFIVAIFPDFCCPCLCAMPACRALLSFPRRDYVVGINFYIDVTQVPERYTIRRTVKWCWTCRSVCLSSVR